MSSSNNNFYLNQQEPNKSCLLALRQIILNQDEAITETTKYGMPCFCYKNKMFCYLWVDKKSTVPDGRQGEPYILMVEGKHLHHPQLETGGRKRMKIFRVNPNEDIPKETIELILKDALNLYQNGVVKVK